MVLALVGVLAGAVALGLGRIGAGATPAREAARLAARLDRAVDEVAITGRPFRFGWEPDGYRFEVARDGAWAAHPLPLLAEPRALPSGLRIDAAAHASGAVTVTADLVPEPPEVLRLAISGGDGTRAAVAFDGLNARVLAADR